MKQRNLFYKFSEYHGIKTNNPFAKDARFFLACLGCIFFVLALNPYIGLYHFRSDQQPFIHLLSIPLFIIFILFGSIDKISAVLFMPAVIAIFLVILSPDINGFRSAYNYISFFLVFFVSVGLLKYVKIDFYAILLLTFWAWLIVGVIQLFYPDFFLFLLYNPRTTDGRGVTSLATEPTYYGIVMLFYILFFKLLYVRYKYFYILLCSVAIIFIAKSSMAVLFLLLYFFVVTFFGRLWSIKLLYLGVFFSIPFIFNYIPDGRMKYLISSLFENPLEVVLVDPSVNDRFFHVYLPLKGFFINFGIPHGFSNFVEFSIDQISIYSGFVILEWFSITGRIMSGLGSALFELGIFGLVYALVPIYVLYPLRTRGISFVFSTLFLYFAIFISAVPVGFTFFPVLLAFVYFNTRYQYANK